MHKHGEGRRRRIIDRKILPWKLTIEKEKTLEQFIINDSSVPFLFSPFARDIKTKFRENSRSRDRCRASGVALIENK